MKSRNPFRFSSTLATLSIAMTLGTQAANTWVGDTNVWDTATTANWTSPTTWTAGDDAVFNAPGTGGLALALTTVSAHNIDFNTTGYSLTGSTLTLTGSTPTITTATGVSASISSVVSGSAGLTKADAGTLTLSGANNYTGTTAVNGGTLVIARTVNVAANGTVTQSSSSHSVANGATLRFDASTVTGGTGFVIWDINPVNIASGGTLELYTDNIKHNNVGSNALLLYWGNSDKINGSGSLNKEGTGVFVINGNGTLNDFTGTLNVNQGMLALQGGPTSAVGNFAVNVATGATLDIRTDSHKIGSLSGAGSVTKSSNYNVSTLTVGNGDLSGDFSGPMGVLSGTLHLAKTGTGTQILSGALSYNGTTTVSGGTLALSGAATLASPTISVASGASFDVSGLSSAFSLASGKTLTAGRTSAFAEDVKGDLTNTAGIINIAGAGATAGTLTHTGNLTLDSGTVKFDLGTANTAGAGVNDLITVSGNLDLTGSTGFTNIVVNKLGPNLADGTYTLITCGGTLTGSEANLNHVGLTAVGRQTFALGTTANSVVLTVTGVPANLVWTGAHPTNPTFWDPDTTANWSGIANGKFVDGDNVLFDDTASSAVVELQSYLLPANVTFNNTTAKPYTITGAAGGIDGITGLVKNGDGSVTITTDNGYTGTTTISNGSLIFGDAGVLGSGNYAANIANDGALVFSGTANQTLGGVLSGTGTLTMGGTGRLTLTAVNTYSGGTTLSSGTLEFGPAGGGTGTYLGTGSLTLNGGTLKTPGTNIANTVITNPVIVNAATSSILDPAGPNINLLGNITGSGSLSKLTGGHAVFFRGDNSGFTGSVSADNIQFSVATAGSAAAAWTSTGSEGLLSNLLTTPGTIHLGSLSGASGSFLGSQNSNVLTTFSIGALNTDTEFAGRIANIFSTGTGTVAITKVGTGTLTLSGLNAYTGSTTVDAGTLALADNGRLTFAIGATSDTNNSISGAGTVTLDGDFAINTTAASALTSGTWLLENVTSLTGAYGSTFTVMDPDGTLWTDAGADKWTKTVGSKLWSFDETTGTLTLGAASGYASWADKFPGLTDKTPGADPDGDGIKNLLEYLLNGNPGAADLNLLPQAQLTTTEFKFTFIRRVDSANDSAQVFEYGSNLVGWTPVNITGTPGAGVVIGAATGTAPDEVQTVTITIPRSAEGNGKLFGRLQVTQP